MRAVVFMCSKETCQHLENPPNSAHQYFPDDRDRIIQNHSQVKILSKRKPDQWVLV